MKFAKTLILMAGSAILAGLILVPLKPGVAHAVVAAFVQVVNDAAHPIPVTASTHLNTPANKVVMLQCLLPSNGSSGNCDTYQRVSPSGAQGPSAFTIPNGDYLVVTDIEWQQCAGTPGATAFFDLSTAASGSLVDLYRGTGTFHSDGCAGQNDHLTSGIVLSTLPEAGVGSSSSTSIKLRGYLTPVP
jgi:hypothetical protein